jgi:chorismate-pyruvate lyase
VNFDAFETLDDPAMKCNRALMNPIPGSAIAAIAAALLSWSAARGDDAAPARAPLWQDSVLARVEALALLQTLNAELLSHDSATLTLERWCDAHHLATPAKVVAARVTDVDKQPSPDQRRELGVSPTEPIRYRRVKLLCGSVILSEADNWYVPARLTPDMNRLLDTTDTPFGKVVQTLHFQRHTLSSSLLWRPLPDGWETKRAGGDTPGVDTPGVPARAVAAPVAARAAAAPDAVLHIPSALLEHRALLSLPDGTPISEVVETYTGNILAFPAPRL